MSPVQCLFMLLRIFFVHCEGLGAEVLSPSDFSTSGANRSFMTLNPPINVPAGKLKPNKLSSLSLLFTGMPAACATILFFLLDQKQAFLIGESHLAEGVLCHLLQTLDLHSRSLIPLCAVFASQL